MFKYSAGLVCHVCTENTCRLESNSPLAGFRLQPRATDGCEIKTKEKWQDYKPESSVKNRVTQKYKPQKNAYVLPLRVFPHRNWKWFVIGSWRLLVVLFFFCPSAPPAQCVRFSFPPVKLGSSCTGGIFLFLSSVKLGHLVGEGDDRVHLRWQHTASGKFNLY